MASFRYLARTIVLLVSVTTLYASARAQFETRGISEAPPFPSSLAVGDFNHDGKLDMAVVSGYGTTVQVLMGNGDGTFQKAVDYAVGNVPTSVATADLNRDGDLDLVVQNAADDTIGILLGKGDGTFLPAVNYNTPPGPIFVTTGDFNGDGKLDLATVDLGDGTGSCSCVAILLGNGDGTFESPITTTTATTPFAIGVGDFNSDGHLDLAVAESFSSVDQVEILLGNGDGTFRSEHIYTSRAGPDSIAVADFNGDHKLDLAVAENEGGTVSIFLGNGDGSFQPKTSYVAEYPLWVAAASLNGDGKLDLVTADLEQLFSGVTVFTGNGDGTFQKGVYYPDGGTNTGQIDRFVAVADFNNDGKPDLVAPDSGSSDVVVLLNTGLVSFSPTTPITLPTQLIGTTGPPMSAMLTNNGSSSLEISSVTFSGKQFSAKTNCKGSISPGGHCSITATFTPQVQGLVVGSVSIEDSASSKPQVVALWGTGTAVELSPAQLTFPAQKVGTKSSPQAIQITNTGKTKLVFENYVYIGGSDFGDFSQSNNCGASLKPRASCTVNVTFTPQRKGARSASVDVPDNAGAAHRRQR